MLTGFQIKAARGGLGLSLRELSANTSVSLATLKRVEKTTTFEIVKLKNSTIDKLVKFYHACGIEFIEENGIIVKKPQLK